MVKSNNILIIYNKHLENRTKVEYVLDILFSIRAQLNYAIMDTHYAYLNYSIRLYTYTST